METSTFGLRAILSVVAGRSMTPKYCEVTDLLGFITGRDLKEALEAEFLRAREESLPYLKTHFPHFFSKEIIEEIAEFWKIGFNSAAEFYQRLEEWTERMEKIYGKEFLISKP